MARHLHLVFFSDWNDTLEKVTDASEDLVATESSVRCTMLRTATHKLVVRPGDVSELYDLVEDPGEQRNR
jgi:hypothetical protein